MLFSTKRFRYKNAFLYKNAFQLPDTAHVHMCIPFIYHFLPVFLYPPSHPTSFNCVVWVFFLKIIMKYYNVNFGEGGGRFGTSFAALSIRAAGDSPFPLFFVCGGNLVLLFFILVFLKLFFLFLNRTSTLIYKPRGVVKRQGAVLQLLVP